MLLYFLTEEQEAKQTTLELEGRRWNLSTERIDVSSESLSEYTCISYSWGHGRVSNPLSDGLEISDRTLPALLVTMRHRPSCQRFWIDALCVPPSGKQRQACLMSMGLIYNCAKEVIVVLSNGTRGALEQMSTSDKVDYDTLISLESEDWISRAWTYQEVVNSRSLYITFEEAHGIVVEGSHFLNCIGYSLSLYKKEHSNGTNHLPRLNAFEDLIADWMISDYQQRSALQVMSNLDKRTQTRPEDHYYAMIGAISAVPADSAETAVDPSEAFMALCEKKGDYSFIYSAAERDTAPGRGWRPVAGDILSILPWHSWGEGQPGHWDHAACFYLDDMASLPVSPLEEEGANFINHWLSVMGCAVTEGFPIPDAIFTALKTMGFKGSSHCVSTTRGYFCPWMMLPPEPSNAEIAILVATQIRWVCGAPGLAQINGVDGISYMPGVFVGSVQTSAATSVRIT